MRAAALLLAIAWVPAACLPASEFRCRDDRDCGAGGTCQMTSYCSFADSSCAGSMQRYGDGAGSLSNDCVGSTEPPTNCPAGYAPLAGISDRRYRRTNQDDWMKQVDDCGDDSATTRTYLAIPNSATELALITSLNGSNKIWLGVSDRAIEGAFVDVLGAPATFLPWKQGSPEVGNNEKDCVLADTPSQIVDEDCNAKEVGVCECEE